LATQIKPLEPVIRKLYDYYVKRRHRTHAQAISYIARRFWMIGEENIERIVEESENE